MSEKRTFLEQRLEPEASCEPNPVVASLIQGVWIDTRVPCPRDQVTAETRADKLGAQRHGASLVTASDGRRRAGWSMWPSMPGLPTSSSSPRVLVRCAGVRVFCLAPEGVAQCRQGPLSSPRNASGSVVSADPASEQPVGSRRQRRTGPGRLYRKFVLTIES